jgi:phosphoribosylformylglycinamidine synthase subunit PurQ / glutaminase
VSGGVAVVVWPGTNCEADCECALASLGARTSLVWHEDDRLPDVDAVVLPGGFAHGDYLRTGALASLSPVMGAVRRHAGRGGLVLGICNGFQVLCEAGLLPGALRRNSGLRFLCKWTEVVVANAGTPFTRRAARGEVLRMPINHFEGNWYCDEEVHRALRCNDQIVLRYRDNPNGSLDDVAAVCNVGRNVLGLMPHPERACEALLGSRDGVTVLGSMLDSAAAGAVP